MRYTGSRWLMDLSTENIHRTREWIIRNRHAFGTVPSIRLEKVNGNRRTDVGNLSRYLDRAG